MSAAQDILNGLRIASPCPASWAEMAGDDRARFCAQCEKHVYDFSKMTAEEVLALIREKEGRVCGRLWRRADGTVITADCPAGTRMARNRRIGRLAWAASAVLAMGLPGMGCARRSPQTDPVAQKLEQKKSADQTCVEVVGLIAIQESATSTTGKTMTHEDWEHLPLR